MAYSHFLSGMILQVRFFVSFGALLPRTPQAQDVSILFLLNEAKAWHISKVFFGLFIWRLWKETSGDDDDDDEETSGGWFFG